MAKRTRVSRSAHRPGGQGPSRTRRTGETATPAADSTTDIVADSGNDAVSDTSDAAYREIASEQAPPATEMKPSRRARRRAKGRPDDLAARAEAEDVWVRGDLRRIGFVSATLVAGLVAAWVLFVLLDVLSLY